MNRSELEALLAQTMHKQPHMPLSPKQHFQSQVRDLSVRPTHRQAQSQSDIEPVSFELHQISSLRGHHKRNASTTPSTRRAALREPSHNLQRSQISTFTNTGVPDFSAEEREAWSKKSPKPTSTSARSRPGNRTSSTPRQQPVQQHQLLLFPPPERLQPIPQPRKQAVKSSLIPFEALRTEADLERPKTSRGISSQFSERAQTSADIHRVEIDTTKESYDDDESRRDRRSKFLEGSMNDRSVGVASSWYHDNTSGSEGFDESNASPANDIDTDSDATPRAGKPLPPTPTPGTVKKSIFRFGGGRHSEESTGTVEEVQKISKERKSLRKSISIWNFHALGEKIFGGSTNDAGSEISVDTITDKRGRGQKDKKTSIAADVDMLNERKRKAEEAYAQQFGIKKQKSNLGQSVTSTPVAVPKNKTIVDEKRPRTPTLLRRRRDQRTPSDHKRATEALDSQKRPSRRDLEEENRELRTMLRESQSMTFSRPASLSSTELAPKGQENFIRGPAVMMSPGKKQGRRREDIPPVPKLPEVGILAEMQNRSGRLRLETSMEKANPVTFETIEEGEEGVEMGRREREIGMPGQWEWPEDVF